MSKTVNNIALIAHWRLDQDSSVDQPNTVRWADGTPANHDDYLVHLSDTHTCVSTIDGMERCMFPDIADVRYDYSAQTWVVGGVGVTPVALSLTDPDAPDDQIQAELHTCQIVYRARIHRRPLSHEIHSDSDPVGR